MIDPILFYFNNTYFTLKKKSRLWLNKYIFHWLDRFECLYLKGTVSVTSSGTPFKLGNARFTTEPFKLLTID